MSSISAEPETRLHVEEHRTASRRRSYLHGKIISRDGAFATDCAVRNLSDFGANIRIGDEELFPVRFLLLCTTLKRAFDAEVVWRRGGTAGLKFHAVHDMTAPLSPNFRVVQRFYTEHSARPSSGL